MYRLICILAVLLAVLPIEVFGQSYSKSVRVVVGEEAKGSKFSIAKAETNTSTVIGFSKLNLLVMKSTIGTLYSKGKITMTRFSNRLVPKDPVESKLKEKGKITKAEFCFQWDTKINCLISAYSQKTKLKELFVRSVNSKTLTLKEEKKEIASFNVKIMDEKLFVKYQYKLSNDSSKLLVLYSMPFDEHGFRKYGLHVLDNKFDEIWSKEVEMPYENNMTDFAAVEIDNDGNVHLLSKIFVDKKMPIIRPNPNYNYELFSYYEKAESVKQFRISVDGYVMGEMQMQISNQEELVCAGFYAKKESHDPTGTFFLKIDPKTQKELVRDKSADLDIETYYLRDVFLKEDGGAFLTAEEFFVDHNYRMDAAGNTSTKTKHIYADIIAVSLSPDGKVDWAQFTEKNQQNGTRHSSFGAIAQGDKLHVVFNDHPKNVSTNKGDKIHKLTKEKGKSNLVLVSFSNGKQTKEILYSSEDKDFWAEPRYYRQISNSDLVIFGEGKSGQCLAKLKFK